LVGTNGLPGSINDSFATGTATSQVNAGNLIGLNNGTAAGSAALSASNKFKSSSYSNFDFSNVWVLYEGSTAPLLRSFLTPMTVTVGSPTVTSKTYDATNSFAGTGTVSYLSPYANPVAQVSGSVSYSLLNKNVGSQQIQVGIQISKGI
jgi:hypothetical protein